MMVMATTPVRILDLVVPLAHEATAMRTTETAGRAPPIWKASASVCTGKVGVYGLGHGAGPFLFMASMAA